MMTVLAAAGAMTAHDITIFFLALGVLLGLARALGEVARRYGQPAVLGELLAGVLLGPTVFDYLSPAFHAWLFPADGPVFTALTGFAQLAVVLLLLVAGLEVELSSVWRQGKAALSVSFTGIVFPFAIGFGLAYLLPGAMGKDPAGDLMPFAAFIGIAMSITAMPVISKVLMDLKLFKSDMGMLIMSAAMVDDLLGWMGFAFVLALITGTGGAGVLPTIGLTLLFVALMLTLGRGLAHRALPIVQARTVWPSGVIGFVLTVALLAGALTEWIGIHAIFGAFIAGVAIGDSRHLRERTRDTIHQFVISIFAPVFFATLALRTNFIEAFNPLLVLTVLVVAIAVKVGGCYLGAKWAGLGQRESLATAFGMTARGAMEMVLAQIAREAGLITDELFVAIVVMALVTSMLAGPMMQRILRRKHRLPLQSYLTDKHILPRLESPNRTHALTAMAHQAARLTGLDAPRVADAVLARERILPTGLPNGLAVPHARLHELDKPCIILALCHGGVDFDSADGQPARVICLLLTPVDQPETQIELLRLFLETFEDPTVRREAVEAQTATELLAVLNLASSEAAERASVDPSQQPV